MKVPLLRSQIGQNAVPNVQLSGGLTPGQAASMTSSFDGFSDAVKAGINSYNEYQDEADRVRVMDAQNKLAELKLHLQSNDTDGFSHKRGVDVVSFDDGQGGGFVDYYQRAYTDGVSDIASRLSNNNQRNMFQQVAEREGVSFKGNLQNYFLRENDTYQQSVYASSADRFILSMNENPANFEAIDENRTNLKAAIGKLTNLEGKSATEAENVYLKMASGAHITNLNTFINSGNLRGALTYKQKYGDEISVNDAFQVDQKIRQKIEDQQIEYLVNQASGGTEESSGPLNYAPQVSKDTAMELRSLAPEQMQSISYKDPRLDAYTVYAAQERGLGDFIPLLMGIRLAGEKSNNNEISPKGARSVMQFIPSTWGDFNKNGKRDINNPADTIDAALDFVDWISKKYKTKDPMVIAAYYNGGGKAAEAVLKGRMPPAKETQNYLKRLDNWISEDFGRHAQQPTKTREEAYSEIWESNAPLDVKEKAWSAIERKLSAQQKIKTEKQTQVYDHYYKTIVSGQNTFEQIPASELYNLAPNQVASLRAVSKSVYTNEIKTDPTVYSMIMLNKEELFKGKPQSIVHQYADKLSAADYKSVTQMYLDVNKPKKNTEEKKDKKFLVTDSTVTSALKPYLNIIGITDTKNKTQLLHYNAVKSDVMQTLLEVQSRNGGHLTWDQINRTVLKNINTNVRITTSRPLLGENVELNRMYAQVKNKGDITPGMLDKIKKTFKAQGRNPDSVTDAEYINAYYSMMRRGF